MSTKIRVMLADDHVVVRQGLSALLESQSDIEIVGEAADGLEAVALARRCSPDVILMDINMPKMNGLEVDWKPPESSARNCPEPGLSDCR